MICGEILNYRFMIKEATKGILKPGLDTLLFSIKNIFLVLIVYFKLNEFGGIIDKLEELVL